MIVTKSDPEFRRIDDLFPDIVEVSFNQNNHECSKKTAFKETCTDRKTDQSGCPEAGSCGKTLDLILLCDNNRSGTDESQSGDYTCSDS